MHTTKWKGKQHESHEECQGENRGERKSERRPIRVHSRKPNSKLNSKKGPGLQSRVRPHVGPVGVLHRASRAACFSTATVGVPEIERSASCGQRVWRKPSPGTSTSVMNGWRRSAATKHGRRALPPGRMCRRRTKP